MGYDALHRGFGWSVPERFNMAEVCSRRWAADLDRRRGVAVVATAPDRPDQTHTYADLQAAANRLSNALVRLGVQRGDRVAIVMPWWLTSCTFQMWAMPPTCSFSSSSKRSTTVPGASVLAGLSPFWPV
jgi:long-subunit acyl-CoA synthetase (AMP-forming)